MKVTHSLPGNQDASLAGPHIPIKKQKNRSCNAKTDPFLL